jgi:hypothetical protein
MDAAAAFSSRFSSSSIEERCATSGADLDACLRKDQAFFVYNAAHGATSIRSPDGTAWIRPLGFCASIPAARARGMQVHAHDVGQEIRMQPAGKVFLIGAEKYADAPGALDMPARQREQDKANALMDLSLQRASAKIKDVKSRAEARRAGPLDLSRMDPRAKAAGPAAVHEASPAEHVPVPAASASDDSATCAQPASGASGSNTIAPLPVSLEMRSQRFAVLAVVEDHMAAEAYQSARTEWWRVRAARLRQKWCADLGADTPWTDTLHDWLAAHPAPLLDISIEQPLFIDYAWPAEAQEWCKARDAALLQAEWSSAGRHGAHAFDYAAQMGDATDAPPPPPSEEPAILAIGACETLEDAEKLAQRAGSTKELKHVDVFVCAMYEWGRLASRHEAAKKHPRSLDEVVPSLKNL